MRVYKISVVIATFNGAKYLAEQIESILNQTYPIYEVVILDDCSTDTTWEILSDYCQKHAQVKVYRNVHNLGCVNTFSSALELTTGDFIALSDQDDIWLPNKIETLLQYAQSEYNLVHSDAYLCNENLNTYALYSDIKGFLKSSSFINYLNYNDVSGCTTLFSRKLLDKIIPIPDGFWMHDHYLALMASYYGKVVYIDKPLIKYRQHANNVLGAKSNISYHSRKLWELNLAKSLMLLKDKPEFRDNLDIDYAIKYHMYKYDGKWPDFAIINWCYTNYGFLQTIKLLATTLGNSKLLNKAFYSMRGVILGK